MTKWEELPMGRCSLLVGLRSSSQYLDQIALLQLKISSSSFFARGPSALRKVGGMSSAVKGTCWSRIGLGLKFVYLISLAKE